ncbi:hypothetical protein I4U23_023381 [Adineta vaga]|nr:hypothetical protein I4U23_023381 [Adineta vaga]
MEINGLNARSSGSPKQVKMSMRELRVVQSKKSHTIFWTRKRRIIAMAIIGACVAGVLLAIGILIPTMISKDTTTTTTAITSTTTISATTTTEITTTTSETTTTTTTTTTETTTTTQTTNTTTETTTTTSTSTSSTTTSSTTTTTMTTTAAPCCPNTCYWTFVTNQNNSPSIHVHLMRFIRHQTSNLSESRQIEMDQRNSIVNFLNLLDIPNIIFTHMVNADPRISGFYCNDDIATQGTHPRYNAKHTKSNKINFHYLRLNQT